MLKLNQQKTEVHWPEAGVTLTLSPLTVSLRQKLADEATETLEPAKGRTPARTKFNSKRYQDLVAAQCIHGWTGVVDGAGQPQECTAEARCEFMEIEPANIFVFTQVQGLGVHLVKETAAAGNA